MTTKSKFDLVLEAVAEVDRSAVGLYANFLLNTTPGERPSGAAYRAVTEYERDPQRVLARKSGCDIDRRARLIPAAQIAAERAAGMDV